MRILIVSQYFWPENFKINDIALGLKEKGHHVSILTGLPNYPQGSFFDGYSFKSKDETWNGMKIYRSKLIPRGNNPVSLFINYFSFVVFGWLKVNRIKEEFDSILVFETSPVTVGIPAIHASKKFKVPYYFWVQDLWPASLTAAGGVTNPLVLTFFDSITRWIYRKSKKVLVQSEAFVDYIKKQDVPEDKIIFYPNTTEEFYQVKQASEKYQNLLPKGFNIMFAGNFGEAQSLNTLVEAAEIVKNKGINVNWVLLGDGRSKAALEKQIEEKKLDNFHMLGSFPGTEMPDFFACADVLLASLKDDYIFTLTIPSKIQSYMACGKPLLASLNGEGANIVKKAECGYTSDAGDAEVLAENVIKMVNSTPEERQKMGENAVRYFKENFERNNLLEKLEHILNN
ncbi:MAG: glycosyltransferase family 4 protein [Bergeyella sp.]